MLYAKTVDGEKIRPSPNKVNCVCPLCDLPVIKKCGMIKIWHWAHEKNANCDTFKESESEWHLTWKNFLEKIGFNIEYVIKHNDIIHRADAVSKNKKYVIELQHSSISTDEICNRTNFYEEANFKVIWIFDASSWKLRNDIYEKDNKQFCKFRWFYSHTSLCELFEHDGKVNCKVMFDFTNGFTKDQYLNRSYILDIKKCHILSPRVGGWGDVINDKMQFIQHLVKEGIM